MKYETARERAAFLVGQFLSDSNTVTVEGAYLCAFPGHDGPARAENAREFLRCQIANEIESAMERCIVIAEDAEARFGKHGHTSEHGGALEVAGLIRKALGADWQAAQPDGSRFGKRKRRPVQR